MIRRVISSSGRIFFWLTSCGLQGQGKKVKQSKEGPRRDA